VSSASASLPVSQPIPAAPLPTARVEVPSTPARPLLVAACLVAAPVCEVIEAVLSPLAGTSTTADLDGIAAHQSAFVASVLVGLLGTALYVPAFLGLLRRTAARRPRLSLVASVLVVASMLGFAGVRMAQAVELQVTRDRLPSAQAAALVDHLSANPIGGVLLVMFLGGSVLGMVCLAVALWRSGGFPRPAVVLLVLFPFVDLAAPGHVGTIASHVVLLVGLTWIAVRLLATERR
jgi:hypothetical protein